MIATAQVVDDGHSLSHEVHHVLWVGATDVVLKENGADALSKNESDVRNGVLISKNCTDLSGGVTCFTEVKNEFSDRFSIGV